MAKTDRQNPYALTQLYFNHRHQFSHYLLRCYALTHQQRILAISADLHGSKLGMTVVADLRCY